ncbi:filamentous hemagglutinin N-terminal domain-containing protein [Erwinia pyrifoliae]|uniref:filamentous hemagglutinin N-terminal domain-containing protein n=1 Tax=Erwinia pyrifoliae TaxID=79967 RepID=UPI0028FC20AE|nr:filamentous hemagglutinin N-terminal domain-containing protein [Erwinia pyrifoliae]
MNDCQPVSLARRAFSYLICYLIAFQPLLTAAADEITPVTPGTQMDAAGNGVPVVNIAAPNQAGISHNQYQQYNVGQQGLILNNATGQLNQTQLAGLIQNNPNLKASQEARAIINEVVGANRSQLQGYTEVAGRAANVMVANPYGITCNGCGFINTPNVTLTTGKPQLDANGNLAALEVSKGLVIVEGKGLDGSNADAVSIVARATAMNAGIHAKDLSMTLGANRIGPDGSVTPITGEGVAPSVAVDTSALGGMYANRIHLVSSEQGVGVNLGNLLAKQNDITLDANGRLAVHNSLSNGELTARAQSIDLSGEVKSSGSATVTARDGISLKNGSLASDEAISLQGGERLQLVNGKLTSGDNISLVATQLATDNASTADAAGNITLQAQPDRSALSGLNSAGRLDNAGQLTVENNYLGATSSDKLDKAIEKIKQGDKSLAAANELIQLENADKRSDALVSKFTKHPSQMNSTERAELAGYLRVYAAEMEKEYGTAVSQELVKGMLSGQDYIKRDPDSEAMASAQKIMNTWGYHKSNASIGDAPLIFGGSVLGITVKGMAANAAIGVGVNTGVQLTGKDPFSYVDVIMAGITSAATTGKGILPSVGINVGGAAIGSGVKGEAPVNSMAGAGAGTVAGGIGGTIIKGVTSKVVEEAVSDLTGAIGGSYLSEKTGNFVKDNLDEKGKNDNKK